MKWDRRWIFVFYEILNEYLCTADGHYSADLYIDLYVSGDSDVPFEFWFCLEN